MGNRERAVQRANEFDCKIIDSLNFAFSRNKLFETNAISKIEITFFILLIIIKKIAIFY